MEAIGPSGLPISSEAFDRVRAALSTVQTRSVTSNDSIGAVQPRIIVEPQNENELARILKLANEEGLSIIPRGGGTKLGWGNAPTRADIVLSTARLDRITEHAWSDLTVSVEAGCTIQKLQSALAQHGQRLAFDPLWPERATVGGVLSTNDSGALRLRFGALRDLIIGVTLALSDGTLAQSGGKVVKNVAGYDIPKLVTGAFGTLGVITRAIFRLHPLPKFSRTLTVEARDSLQVQELLLQIQNSKLAHSALQCRFASDSAVEADILFEGTEAGVAAQCSEIARLAKDRSVREADSSSWNIRAELWSPQFPSLSGAADVGVNEFSIAKISVLPASLAQTMDLVKRVSDAAGVRHHSVMQATGLGWIRFEGEPPQLRSVLQSLREALEKSGASLVVFHSPAGTAPFDTWGASGDSLPLMRSMKHHFDPKMTLNPGRFVGGI